METRSKLEALAAVTSDRLAVLENDIANLKLEVKANTQLDLVFSRWRTGYWHDFPIATRCYIALEELRWEALVTSFEVLTTKNAATTLNC